MLEETLTIKTNDRGAGHRGGQRGVCVREEMNSKSARGSDAGGPAALDEAPLPGKK